MSTPYLPRFERRPDRSFVVTEREVEILKALNQFRYLRTGQVKRLVFANNSSPQSARRRLRFLYDAGYIDRLVPYVRAGHGGAEVVYHLARKGEQLLKDLGIDVLRPTKTGQVRHQFLHHALEMSEFRLNLQLALRKHDDVALHRFICDFELKSHISRRKSRFDYRLFDEVQDPKTKRKFVVYPDGLIILKATKDTEKRALILLEIDRSTEPLRKIQEKFLGYRHYYRQKKFAKFGKFARLRILFQTTSCKRLKNMAKSIHDYEDSHLVWFSTRDQISEDSLLTHSIWKDTAGGEHSLLK